MSKVILTRYLYIYDEVCLSFIYSLLKKQDINECYFWMFEMYNSGFKNETWCLIWFIYYDFYFISYPMFSTFIKKKCEQNTVLSLMIVIKNLFRFTPTSEVFITRQYNFNVKEINYIFRGKKPKWLSNINNQHHALFRYLNKKLYHFAVSSLPENIDDNLLFNSISTYFDIKNDEINTLINNSYNNNYDNNHHKIWSIICLLEFNSNYYKEKKKIYMGISDDEYANIMKIENEDIPLSKYGNKLIYKTLQYKRKYSIQPIISAFYLTRENCEKCENINNLFWYNWEYHAYLSPIWKERFDQYNININNETYSIDFTNDEEHEKFYNDWNYEPDEQTQDTINKRMVCIENNNWKSWYFDIFEKEPLFMFKDDFRYNY